MGCGGEVQHAHAWKMRCTVRSWGIRGVLLEKKGSRGGPQGRNGQAQVGGEGLRVQRVQGEGEHGEGREAGREGSSCLLLCNKLL